MKFRVYQQQNWDVGDHDTRTAKIHKGYEFETLKEAEAQAKKWAEAGQTCYVAKIKETTKWFVDPKTKELKGEKQ